MKTRACHCAEGEVTEEEAEYDEETIVKLSLPYAIEVGTSIQPSLIPGAGFGLITTIPRKAGDLICTYRGKRLRTRDAMKTSDKRYLMRLGPQSYVDAKYCFHSPARYINDCRNENGYNIEMLKVPEEGIARVVATRDVKAGDELYARYGKFYWLGSHIVATILSDGELVPQRELS